MGASGGSRPANRRSNVARILEDLSTLSPKKLQRRLEELAEDALPCLGIYAYAASPEDGLTTVLWVDSRRRRDVLDLARVVETEPGGFATVAWSRVSLRSRSSTLLLRASFDRPVRCAFDVRIDVPLDTLGRRRSDVLLLAAASSIALSIDTSPLCDKLTVCVSAPASNESLLELLALLR